MNFIKGAALGIVAGTIVGVVSSDNFKEIFNKGKRKMRHFQKKYGM